MDERETNMLGRVAGDNPNVIRARTLFSRVFVMRPNGTIEPFAPGAPAPQAQVPPVSRVGWAIRTPGNEAENWRCRGCNHCPRPSSIGTPSITSSDDEESEELTSSDDEENEELTSSDDEENESSSENDEAPIGNQSVARATVDRSTNTEN